MQKKRHFLFNFIKMGSIAGTEEHPVIPNRIYLDVGNKLQKGVFDHHQSSDYKSAAEIICNNPDLLLSSIQKKAKEIEIIMHYCPDFDAIASAYLTIYLIEHGHLPEGAKKLADYASLIDQGMKIFSPEQIKTPSTAAIFINRKITAMISSEDERNRTIIKTMLPLIEYLLKNMIKGIDPESEESLDWNSKLLSSIIPDIKKDRELYMKDVEDPDKSHKTEILSIILPCQNMTEWEKIDAIFINNPSSALFRYSTGNDTIRSPQKKGFMLTLVHYTKKNETIISVDAKKKYSLVYLGTILEFKETLLRRACGDTRMKDDRGTLKPVRPGYHNPDPWYDGRGHNYTIVASPRKGSVIPPEEIRRIVATYTDGLI
ncbi:MAG: hypothetical protein ABRQ38_03685 [Candidatus Eremiobacterota bacterium]